MRFWLPLMLLASTLLYLSGCSLEEKRISYPADQLAFFALNQQCHSDYMGGVNEIQKSVAFKRCNSRRTQTSRTISNWIGTITDISTDQGADVVSLTVETSIDGFDVSFATVGNRLADYGSNTLITPSDGLFSVLSEMKEGDVVAFDAEFLMHPEAERGLWEASLTERGSIQNPEFIVRFRDIHTYADNKVKLEQTSVIEPASDLPAPSSIPLESASGNVDEQIDSSIEASNSPSFNCKSATSITERTICSNSRLATVDTYTAKMYKCLLRLSPADTKGLKSSQREWIKERDSCSDDVGCLRVSYGNIAEYYMTKDAFNECQQEVAH